MSKKDNVDHKEHHKRSPVEESYLDDSNRSSAAYQTYREVLPSQFVDEILYSYVLCKYGDEGEDLLDRVSEPLDKNVRAVLHDYFTELDKLSMHQIKRAE